jgi:hypothetical protein
MLNLRNYRQLQSKVRTGKDGQPYLAVRVLWSKPDGVLVRLGAIALYPRHVEKIIPTLKSFQTTFASEDGLQICRLPMEPDFAAWREKENRGDCFIYREVSNLGENHAVIAIQPKNGKPHGSAIWIHEADLSNVIAFFESAFSPPKTDLSDLVEKMEKMEEPPPARSVATSSEEEWEREVEEQQEFEARLQEMDELLMERHELAAEQYREDERNLDDGWPYPDSDNEN